MPSWPGDCCMSSLNSSVRRDAERHVELAAVDGSKGDTFYAADRADFLGAWRVVNGETGTVLTSGSGAGAITFPRTSLRKITFEITGSTGTPKIAEYETYAGQRHRRRGRQPLAPGARKGAEPRHLLLITRSRRPSDVAAPGPGRARPGRGPYRPRVDGPLGRLTW